MTNYDYREEMKSDIMDYIKYKYPDIQVTPDNREEWSEKLNDKLWVADSVTGNGSGSYTFNSYKAKEYIMDNMDLCTEALANFAVGMEEVADRFMQEDFEYFDVTIRCYLLGEMIETVLDELEKNVKQDHI